MKEQFFALKKILFSEGPSRSLKVIQGQSGSKFQKRSDYDIVKLIGCYTIRQPVSQDWPKSTLFEFLCYTYSKDLNICAINSKFYYYRLFQVYGSIVLPDTNKKCFRIKFGPILAWYCDHIKTSFVSKTSKSQRYSLFIRFREKVILI